MDKSNSSDVPPWHEELSAASLAISPLTVSPNLLLHRAETLRAVKAAPHQASLWLDYLSQLNEERKERIHHNPSDTDLHMRMHQALQTVYERATRVVPMTAANRHSQVYLQLWLDLAALRAENDPDDAHVIFKHLKSHRIGQSLPLFWNSWAELELRQGNHERAARFRREANICSSTAATPSRTQGTTGNGEQTSSVQRSARRRVPLRPARRVVNPTTTPSSDKENQVAKSPGRTAVSASAKAATARAGHTPFKPKSAEISQSNSNPTEPYSMQRTDNSAQKGKQPVLTSASQNSQSPEVLRSQQVSQQRSPPQLFPSAEKWATATTGEHQSGLVQSRARQDNEEERLRRKQLEDERLRQLELQRLHEKSLQRERERTLQREYEQERHRKYAREQEQDIARQRERQTESMRAEHMDMELEKKRQQLRDLDRQRYGYRKSEEISPRLRNVASVASDHRKRNVHEPGAVLGSGSNRSDVPRSSRGEPHPSSSRDADENISPSPRHMGANSIVDSTPSTSERPTARATSGHGRSDRGVHDATQDSKTAKLVTFFRGIQAEDLVSVHGRLYLTLEMVGKGGSSKVFKVLSSDMKIYALKRVKVPLCSSFRATLESYANEIALLKKLRGCPSIIQLYDAEVRKENGMIQLIMEYGDVDLAKHLFREKGKKVNENLRRAYWQQMLEAVHTIHEARIIHGDLKPANFLIVSGSLKLIDFGIAKAIQTDDTTKIVRESQVGTPNYMSPEALSCEEDEDEEDDETGDTDKGSGRGSRPRRYKVGRASDIWSLGCILYQMVYGRAPFAHIKSTMQKLQAIQNPGYKIPFRDTDDPYVIDVLKGCLERNPEKRMSIPELLKHPFISPESESRRWHSESEVTTTMSTLTDSRLYVSSVFDQLDKRGYLSLPRWEESSEKLISEIARVLPLGSMATETGLSARKDRQGHLLRGVMTPTTSGFTGSQL